MPRGEMSHILCVILSSVDVHVANKNGIEPVIAIGQANKAVRNEGRPF